MTTITVSLTGSTAADLAAISTAATAALAPAPPPPPPPPPAEVSWVYHAGKLVWAGDWSYGVASIGYDNLANPAPDGTGSIAIDGGPTSSEEWGGWQPYINAGCQGSIGLCFDTTPFKYLIFSMKPTVANQKLKAVFLSAGDTADGIGLYDLGAYSAAGDNPPIGEWSSYKVPLSAFALTDLIVLKFSIGDQTGLPNNMWYLADVGFSAT
jgi:hypothetical protein